MITERTLEQTVAAIEQGGVEEIAALLREPTVQARLAESVNRGVEDLLDRPVGEILGDVSPERTERVRQALVDRILYLFRHPTTEEIVLARLGQAVANLSGRSVGDVLTLIGDQRSRELTEQAADWFVEASRGPRFQGLLRASIQHRTNWILSVPIGRVADYLPPNAVSRVEGLLADPLWAFLQRRVPKAVADLPIATMVETRLRSYPIQKVEELIWRISRRELVLIIYLGGFLGALIGSLMLSLQSFPAGLVASGLFVLLSLVFINLKS